MTSARTLVTHVSPTTTATRDQHTEPTAGTVRTGRVGRGEIAACFPLVARPRPACLPLRTRLDHVATAARAAAAATDRQVTVREAGRALTGAAQIARDCHQPDLARTISARHIGLYTDLTRPLTAQEAAQVVGAATGRARAHLRTDPDQGVAMLTRILGALHGRLPIQLDGLPLPFGDIDTSLAQHRQLVGLARTQLVVGGTFALAMAGRWADAAVLAATYAGNDDRLLEGRQAQVTSRLLNRDGNGARALISASSSGVSPDEDYDAATCLTALCASATTRRLATDAMVARYRAGAVPREGYVYYRARYGAAVAIIAHAHRHPAAPAVGAQTTAEALAAADGYAAQEVLRHAAITASITDGDRSALAEVVKNAGLTGNVLNGRLPKRLGDIVDLASHAVRPDL
ncbi:hypothetical protein [Promicromonospora sukumoe]|uniref:Uncharacterized protein n=1 Tax=Promicromonospora sukumoe TaxID=88382 RepID=A0A7W3J7C4_9MICO|nr:hypothetical protein [Promicromonospora sukumoe]MBA8807662.1 hypothetical protein [Promicromonospora sukumoe]